MMSPRILVASSNPGKLRDFAGAAEAHGITISTIPNFSSLPPVVEDGATFEANARKKAEACSLAVPGELVLADDSGLEIDALGGAPGIHSARYAAAEPHMLDSNIKDNLTRWVAASRMTQTTPACCANSKAFPLRSAQRDLSACWLPPGMAERSIRSTVWLKEQFWMLPAGTTALDMIRCFIFRRSGKRWRN